LGLVNLRARTYNPRLGAFTSVDPVEGILSRSASRNGYSYVEGNPTNDAVGELKSSAMRKGYADANRTKHW